jgi:FlaA1/EpsC-like NDP-sugar epimerase
VGIIDDDILLRGQYIGGIKVHGTLEQAPQIIKKLKADAVVIACVLTPARMEVARQTLGPCGVKVTQWVHEEHEV